MKNQKKLFLGYLFIINIPASLVRYSFRVKFSKRLELKHYNILLLPIFYEIPYLNMKIPDRIYSGGYKHISKASIFTCL